MLYKKGGKLNNTQWVFILCSWDMYIDMCVCIYMCVYMYAYTSTHDTYVTIQHRETEKIEFAIL